MKKRTFKERHFRYWYYWHRYGELLMVTVLLCGGLYYADGYLVHLWKTSGLGVKLLIIVPHLAFVYTLCSMWISRYRSHHILREHMKSNSSLKANSYLEKKGFFRGDSNKSKKQ